ncbi:MAG TPA: YjjG family noncanonical pyrimidine nucleotidase [Bdellovibrionota bacterium]|nr:YjjG family noncanonical pyrimidine nucleotidase [Bdellovibrionota bacterium]
MSFREYRLFLFDADDTLFDFSASETQAFSRTLGGLGVTAARAMELLPSYRRISRELWGFLEQKKITQAELRTERFRRLFALAGIEGEAEPAGVQYLDHLSQGAHLMPGALEVCRELKSRGLPIGIVTNGFRRVQEPRFKASPLSGLIDWLVISEDCGVAKPDPRIFREALRQASHAEPGTALFVGDRLESDIHGAEGAGLASCWFNPRRETNGSGIRPRYEIAALPELLA